MAGPRVALVALLCFPLVSCLPSHDDYCAVRWQVMDKDDDGYVDARYTQADLDDRCQTPELVGLGDCDDADPSVNPAGVEVCDDLDNDCDGQIDPEDAEDPRTWYLDADEDGYGDPASSTDACAQPVGFVDNARDCDDTDPDLNPDTVWYGDADGDGFGTEEYKRLSCEQPDDFVPLAGDCDDTDPTLNPDTPWYPDADGDGWGTDVGVVTSCDEVPGSVRASGDCDDDELTTFPDADEYCDQVDNDCDDEVDEDHALDAATWWSDDDEDGFGDPDGEQVACDQPSGAVDNAEDCNDNNDTIHPDAVEVSCDGVDDDCDGTEDDALDAGTWYLDGDTDGYGDDSALLTACEAPSGYADHGGDCDDANRTIHPYAAEVCDTVDNNCDGETDEDTATDASTWYADGDSDTYGDPDTTTTACGAPSGYVADASDCDDANNTVNPAATEVCDDVDNDCNGTVDDDSAADAATWYADADEDSFGDPLSTTIACDEPSGYLADASDCDDTDFGVNPDAEELCDTVDNDCDGDTDESTATDVSTWYADSDGDGDGDAATTQRSCSQPTGYVGNTDDCDDGDASVNSKATEVCDTVDNDCDGDTDEDSAADAASWYADADGDGFGDPDSWTTACDQPTDHLSDDTDCDDGDASVNSDASEVCDGVDNNCDGTIDEDSAADAATWYADSDGDGEGDLATIDFACDQPSGFVANTDDCDDSDGAVNTSATEVCDDEDNDCDTSVDEGLTLTTWYADNDGDGYGDPDDSQDDCGVLSGYATTGDDCDDDDSAVNPGASEVCEDGVDNDCDGTSSGCWLSGTVSLSDADVILTGESAGDEAGTSVAGVGDLDGDGLSDLFVGAPQESAAGAAYVFYGPVTSGSLGGADDVLTGASGSELGGSGASAGDLDGDGLEDLVVGAPGEGSGTGAAYVFLGPVSASGAGADLALAELTGEASSDQLGHSVSQAGDFDGDGVADLVVGANLESSVGNSNGAAYLVLGPVTAGGDVGTVAAAKWTGQNNGDAIGESLAVAGDVDGDGLWDLIIGGKAVRESGGANSGAAYVLLAASGAASGDLDGVADAKLEGANGGDQAGHAAAGAGDVDGDGYDDLLVGAWQRDVSGGIADAGAAYLVLGPVTGTVALLTGADATLEGEQQFDQAGISVSAAGDVNLDGKSDVLVGAAQEPTGGPTAGAAYLYLGPLSGTASLSAADVKLVGEASADNAGTWVSFLEDSEGDGYPELLIGAPGATTGAGNVYTTSHARW